MSFTLPVTGTSPNQTTTKEALEAAVDTALATKADLEHGHAIADVSGLSAALAAAAATGADPAALTRERQLTSVSQGRPGELLERYTTRLTGDREGAPVSYPVVVGPRGRAVQVTGAGVIALRDRINLRDGQGYRLSARFFRQTNPTDPSGATVRLRIQWLSAAYADAGSSGVYDATLTAAMGLQEIDTTLGVNAAIQPPAGAVYAVPYIRTFDLDGVTLVEQIEVSVAGVAGPAGPRGSQGIPGPAGPRGPRGNDGPKGDPGNFVNFGLIGASTELSDRPASANEGDAWGLIADGTITIFIWSDSAWLDAGPITSPTDFPVANTLFVSATGDNTRIGTSEQTAVATIERAVELAAAREDPTLIRIGPGTYESEGHIDLPDDCAVVAAHRTVTIVPAPGFEERNVFRLGSGCFVEGPTFAGWRIDDLDNPREGFAIAFRPGAVIRRVPYAHKIVAYRGMPPEMVGAPLDRNNGNPAVGNGMGVCIADGATISAFSAFPNIMTWGATPSNPNGIGYVARNKALINAVNAVSLWCHKHHLTLGGGQIILSSCSSQFGDYSLWSEGYGQSLRPPAVAAYAADPTVAPLIEAAADDIIDDMWADLVAEELVTGWTAQHEAFTRRDAAIFLKAVGYALTEGRQRALDEFARGFFIPVEDSGDPAICTLEAVFDSGKTAAFVRSFQFMRGEINALAGVSGASQTAVTNLVAMVISALTDPQFRKERSLITAIGHQWTFPLSGVTRSAVPPVFGGSGRASRISRSIRQRKGGRVQFSGQDDQGNAVFVGGLEINARTGQLGGRPFDSAVELRSIEAAIATGV
jgi:hypothetical protein